MNWFPFLSLLWAIAVLGAFVHAIRLSYAVERLTGKQNRWGLPMKTNVFASAFGTRGGGDPEVDAVRRKLRSLLAFIAAMFIAGWLAVSVLAPAGGG